MKKKLSPEKLIVIVGIIFATVLVLVNVFFDFVPHTVKTENIKPNENEVVSLKAKTGSRTIGI